MTSGYAVIDASVSLKWALDDEQCVEEAVALRDAAIGGAFKMVVPSLWLYEVANGLAVAVRRGRLAAEDGVEAMRHLVQLGIRFADPAASDVFEDSVRYGIATYDAAYLALADALGASMWTGDRRLYELMRDRVSFVCWIGDYS